VRLLHCGSIGHVATVSAPGCSRQGASLIARRSVPTAPGAAAMSEATGILLGMETTIDDEAERYLRQLSAEWVRPEQGECLTCFVDRMLHRFGCDGTLRFALFFRDQRAPAAAALEQTLGDAGGYCDCEVLMNAVEPAAHLSTPERWEVDAGGREVYIEAAEPTVTPDCLRVPAGSTQPCANWAERARYGDDDDDGWEGYGWDDDDDG
jgi:hypothetical protein